MQDMQSSEAVAQAMALLAPLAAGGANVAQGIAVKVLGDMVAQRLQRDGHAGAWQEFRSNPQNDSLLRHLLQQTLSQDAEFRGEFEAAVAAARREKPRAPGQSTITITGSGDAQIGDRGDTVNGGRVATRGSSYHEGHVYNTTRNRVTHKKNHAGVFVGLGLVAILVLVLIIKGLSAAQGGGSGLTASSTCQQFLNDDEQTQQQALVDVAMSKGIGGFGSPLALPEIQYECSSTPTMTLGAIVERDKGEF
jgi:hypothetical protein